MFEHAAEVERSAVPVELKPRDWLSPSRSRERLKHATAQAHAAFVDRTRFGWLTPAYLTELRAAQVVAETTDGLTPRLAIESATALLQNQPGERAVALAERYIAKAGPVDSAHLRELTEIVAFFKETPAGDASVPDRVNWAVNNRCPMTCVGCYNHFAEKNLTGPEADLALERLSAAGVRHLIVSGGDPILWGELERFLLKASDLGLKVGVDTTGYTLSRRMAQLLARTTTYVGLPIDAPDDESAASFRRTRKNDVVTRALSAMSLLAEYDATIKVNTVVSASNIHVVPQIAALLPGGVVQHWSLFQHSSLRSNETASGKMKISEESFAAIAHVAGVIAARKNIRPRVRAAGARAMTHIFVRNDGFLTTFGIEPGHEFILGHVLTDDISVVSQSPLLRRDGNKFSEVDRFQA